MPLFMSRYEGPDSVFTVNKQKAKKKSVYAFPQGEDVEPNIKKVNPMEHKKNFNEFMKKIKLITNGLRNVIALSSDLSTSGAVGNAQSVISLELDALLLLDVLELSPSEKEKVSKYLNLLYPEFYGLNEVQSQAYNKEIDMLIDTTNELISDIEILLNSKNRPARPARPARQDDESEGGPDEGIGAGIRCRKYGGEMNHDLYIDTKYLL